MGRRRGRSRSILSSGLGRPWPIGLDTMGYGTWRHTDSEINELSYSEMQRFGNPEVRSRLFEWIYEFLTILIWLGKARPN